MRRADGLQDVRGKAGRRVAMGALASLFLLAGGCASDRFAVEQYRLAPYRPSVNAVEVDGVRLPMTTGAVAVVPQPVAVPAVPDEAPFVVPGLPEAATGTVAAGARMLRPGSRLDIRLRGIPQPESFSDQVDDLGEITLPYLGSVQVAGLTASQAERHIERTYVERRIFRSVNVIITTEEEEYFVQGEVRRPGKYVVTRNMSLMQAISEAGGFTPFADRRRIRIMRENGSFTDHNAGDISGGSIADPPIQPKDIINVPRSIW